MEPDSLSFLTKSPNLRVIRLSTLAFRIPGFRQLQHNLLEKIHSNHVLIFRKRKFILIMSWYSGLPKPVDPFTPRSSHGKMTLPSTFEAFLTCVNLWAKSYEVTIQMKSLRQNFLKIYSNLRIYKKIFSFLCDFNLTRTRGERFNYSKTVADLNVVGHNWHISEVQGSIDFIHHIQRCGLVVMKSKYLKKRAKM